MNTAYETALKWIDQGIAVIPIRYMDKKPDARALRRAGAIKIVDSQVLAEWETYQKRLPTDYELKCFFPGTGAYNLAVVAGWQNLVVIDFDTFDGFIKWYPQHQVETYMVRTARGIHVYLFTEQSSANRKAPGIDIKSAGGYVLAPPSVHPTGALYDELWPIPIAKVESVDSLLPADLFPEPAAPKLDSAAQYEQGPVSAPDIWTMLDNPLAGRDLIRAIKARFSIRDFVPGPYVTRANGTVSVHCPFPQNHEHGDQGMSAWIRDDLGLFFCQKCCPNRGWDVINLYAEITGISNREAIMALQKCL